MKKAPDKLVFYDGDCGFCNQSVQFILKFQKDKSLQFLTLQSSFAEKLFQEKGWELPDLSTVYFYENEKLYAKSDAGISIAKHLRFPFSWFQFLWIVPQFIRDKGYDFIAQRRHKLSKGFCAVPTSDQKKQFIG
ncbi:MAG: DCC1-like thiol-disulfide oxidoreductase family protein [Crocinitomicaceae bacterium]